MAEAAHAADFVVRQDMQDHLQARPCAATRFTQSSSIYGAHNGTSDARTVDKLLLKSCVAADCWLLYPVQSKFPIRHTVCCGET